MIESQIVKVLLYYKLISVTYIVNVPVHCLLHALYVITFKVKELLIFVLCCTDVY